MNRQLRHRAAIQTSAGRNKVITAVRATINAVAGSGYDDRRIARYHRYSVRVELRAFLDILPILAAILAADDPSLFNGAKDEQRVLAIESEPFDVAYVRRPREGPVYSLGQSSQLLTVDPGIAAIAAFEYGRRPGADIELAGLRVLCYGPFSL